MFEKDLYGAMRQQGHIVEVVDRTALAVQRALNIHYDLVIIDSDTIGLSAADSAEVISKSCEGTSVIIAGQCRGITDAITVAKPLDIQEISGLVRSLCEPILTKERSY